jgi:hypothetical protein
MSDKLMVAFWGASVNADGVWAIGAAVVIILAVIFVRCRR